MRTNSLAVDAYADKTERYFAAKEELDEFDASAPDGMSKEDEWARIDQRRFANARLETHEQIRRLKGRKELRPFVGAFHRELNRQPRPSTSG
jgi:hypothetical protein